jgi:hypothetical protein
LQSKGSQKEIQTSTTGAQTPASQILIGSGLTPGDPVEDKEYDGQGDKDDALESVTHDGSFR